MATLTDLTFLGSKITVDGECSHEIKRCLLFGRKAMTNLDSILKSRDITLRTKVHTIKAMVFPVVVYGCESLTMKKAECWRTDAFELWCWRKLSKSPLDSKEIKPVSPKGNQPWMLTGRTDAEAEVPVLWPSDVKTWLIGKDPAAGKDWRQKEKGTTEDEMVGRHHWLNGHEFKPTLGDNEGQGSRACCSPRGPKESRWLRDWTTMMPLDRVIDYMLSTALALSSLSPHNKLMRQALLLLRFFGWGSEWLVGCCAAEICLLSLRTLCSYSVAF